MPDPPTPRKIRKKRTEEEKREVARRLVESVYKAEGDQKLFDEGKRTILKKSFKRRGEYVAPILPPPGRKPLHPTVYDWWDDEAREVLDNLSETEIHNAMMKKRGITLDEHDEEESFICNLLFSHRNRQERREALEKLWDECRTRKAEYKKHQALLSQIEDLQDPNIFGFFYTNGYYDHDPPFSVHHDYYEKHLKKEREFAKIFKRTDAESFTNKFRRHFWPPKVQFCPKFRRYFRTRGSYLDFPENIYGADGGPKKKPDFMDFSAIDFNYDHSATLVQDETQENPICEDEEEGEGMKVSWFVEATKGNIMDAGAYETGDAAISRIMHRMPSGKNGKYAGEDFYYDDEKGEFFLKKIGLESYYYFDEINGCWRQKRRKARKYALNEITPYDYYFDHLGRFVPRDLFNGDYIEDVSYDPEYNIWRYDPKESSHKKAVRAQFFTHTQLIDVPGRPMPHDYFFDEREGQWSFKKQRKVDENIEWDFNGFRYHLIHSGTDWEHWRQTTGYSPDDFYWDDGLEKFQLRPQRQFNDFFYSHLEGIWRKKASAVHNLRKGKTSEQHQFPDNFFFEDGMFKLKEKGRDDLYKRMKYALIYRKKEVPLSGLYPKDYYFDRERGYWIPKIVRAPLRNLKEANVAFNPAGPKAELSTPKDYFWDIEEGIFLKKSDYEEYFFDIDDGVYKSVLQRKQAHLTTQPHDYYFDGKKFEKKREPLQKGEYLYDPYGNVYRLSTDLNDPKKSKGDPRLWYFDYNDEQWHLRNEVDPSKLHKHPNGLFIQRAKTKAKTPLDFAFDSSSGHFILIKEGWSEDDYQFVPSEGIFKTKSPFPPKPTKSGLTSRDYYWSDRENGWRLKVKIQAKDYFWDPNNKYYRLTIGVQSRSGLKPTDYNWNPHLGSWITKPGKRGIIDEKLDWDPLRNYEKPWILEEKLQNKEPKKKPQAKSGSQKERRKTTYEPDPETFTPASVDSVPERNIDLGSVTSVKPAEPMSPNLKFDSQFSIGTSGSKVDIISQKSAQSKHRMKESSVDSQATFGPDFWDTSNTKRNSKEQEKDIFKVDKVEPPEGKERSRRSRESENFRAEASSKRQSQRSDQNEYREIFQTDKPKAPERIEDDSTSQRHRRSKQSEQSGAFEETRGSKRHSQRSGQIASSEVDIIGSKVSVIGSQESISRKHRHHHRSKKHEDVFEVDMADEPEERKQRHHRRHKYRDQDEEDRE